MSRLLYRNSWLLAILLFALLIRLPAVGYGLPLHLFGDEEVNVYSALQMIQLHTVLPVLHPQQFQILYEPPLLSYVYAAAFVPTIGVLYFVEGRPPISHLADSILLNPSLFWIVGRLICVLISLFSIYFVYRIGLYLFKEKRSALWAAFFFATSFTDVTLAATTRHWEISTSLSLLSLLLVLKYINTPTRPQFLLWIGGIVLGLSFGAGYLVYYLPFIGLIILYDTWNSVRAYTIELLLPALRFVVGFVAVGGVLVVVAPSPFVKQIITHVTTSTHSLGGFLSFYSASLLYYETPLLIFTIVGLIVLWHRKRYDLMIFFAVFLAVMVPIMYVFLVSLERYLEPLIPILALIAGYGTSFITQIWSRHRVLLILGGLVLCAYIGGLYGRYADLVYKNDTRLEARTWILANIPSDANVLITSWPITFNGTPESIARMKTLSPDIIRGRDQALLRNPSDADRFNSYNIYLAATSSWQALINHIVDRTNSNTYLLADSWGPHLTTEPIKTFSNGSTFATDALFIGGEPYTGASMPILTLLWSVSSLGPQVYLYKITADSLATSTTQ